MELYLIVAGSWFSGAICGCAVGIYLCIRHLKGASK